MARIETQMKQYSSTHFLQATLDALSASVVILDESGTICYVNQSWCRFADAAGFTWNNYGIGRNYLEVVADTVEDSAVAAGRGIRDVMSGERATFSLEYPCDMPDERRWFFMSVTRFVDQMRQWLVVAHEDITERKQVEQDIRQARDELATLLAISQTMLSTLELAPLLEQILEALQTVLPYEEAAILTCSGEMLSFQAYQGPRNPQDLLTVSFAIQRIPIIYTMMDTHEPFCIMDITADTALAQILAGFGQPLRHRAWLGVPLLLKEQVIGMLSLLHPQPGHYHPEDVQRAQAFANQVAIAIENAQLYEHAQVTAAAGERERIARELHDAVTQTLFSANLIAKALPDVWKRSPELGQQGLDELCQLTSNALAEMRTLLLELRPTTLMEKPLTETVRHLARAVMGRGKVPVTLQVKGECTLPPTIKLALYRIVQEALNNIVKHARARTATIHMQCQPDGLILSVRDDGQGFDPASVEPDCLGLNIMQERAAQIGATLTITSQPETGTCVTVTWSREHPLRNSQ